MAPYSQHAFMHLTLEQHISPLDPDVSNLDLSPIKETLTRSNGDHRWTSAQAETAELWYRRFLHLKKKYPSVRLVPRKFIDQFWHTHILDTRKYAADCEQLFGQFLHHYPYFGMNGPADAARWNESVNHTEQLFESEFGKSSADVEFPAVVGDSNLRVSAYCSRDCSSPCSDG